MLFSPYYAKNYAGIIDTGLLYVNCITRKVWQIICDLINLLNRLLFILSVVSAIFPGPLSGSTSVNNVAIFYDLYVALIECVIVVVAMYVIENEN